MVKKLIYLLFALAPLLSMGQSTDAQLTTQANVIRNEINPAGNTKGRIADMFQALINSKQSIVGRFTVSGTDTYTATTGSFVVSYSTQFFLLRFTNANTGPATLNINGLGAKVILKDVTGALVSGDIKAGGIYFLAYDGTNFQMIGAVSSGGGGAITDGSGTTTDGSSVDWNGPITENVAISAPGGNVITIGADLGGGSNRSTEVTLYGGFATEGKVTVNEDVTLESAIGDINLLQQGGAGNIVLDLQSNGQILLNAATPSSNIILSNVDGGSLNLGDTFTAQGDGVSLTSDQATQIISNNADISLNAPNGSVQVSEDLRVTGTTSTPGEIRFYEPTVSGTNYSSIKVAGQAADIVYTLPTTAPAVTGYVLSSTTGGAMSWVAQSGGGGISDGDKGDITVSGSGTVWELDAGVVADAEIATHTTTKISTTNKALLNSAIVYNDQANTYGDGLVQTFNPSGTNPGLVVGTHSARPSSPIEGAVFFNSTTKDAEMYIDGTWTGLTRGEDITESTTARTITDADRNKTIVCTNAGSNTITLNGTPEVGTGVFIFKAAGSGAITLAASGSLKAIDTQLLTDNAGAWVQHEGSGVWRAVGALGAAASGSLTLTGDVTGTGTGTVATTLPTVNSNVGSFGSATLAPVVTVNGKGLITAISTATITPAIGSITGLGTGVPAALAINVGSAGAPILFNGAAGTPSSINISNGTALPAASVVNTPAGGIAATNVQTALNELDTEKATPAYADAKVVDAITDGETTTAPSRNATFDALALKAELFPLANRQTGTTYTAQLSDIGKRIEMSNTSANTITIPLEASVNFPDNSMFAIVMFNTGQTTIAFAGTFRNFSGTLDLPGQYSMAIVQKITDDEWYLWNGAPGISYTSALTRTGNNVRWNGALLENVNLSGAFSVGIGAAHSAKFSVTGLGTTTGALVNFEDNGGLDRLTIFDNGQITSAPSVSGAAATAVSINATVTATANSQTQRGFDFNLINVDGAFTGLSRFIAGFRANSSGTYSYEFASGQFNTNGVSLFDFKLAGTQILRNSLGSTSLRGGTGTGTSGDVTIQTVFTSQTNNHIGVKLFTGSDINITPSPLTRDFKGAVIDPSVTSVDGSTIRYDALTIQPTFSIGTSTLNDNRLIVPDATSQVGFGVADPTSTLHVVGTTKLDGSVTLPTAGNGILIKEGTNATMGVATMVGGTITVSTTKVTANSRIFLTIQGGTLTNVGSVYVSARTAATSFAISSTNILDTADVAWMIIEPAP